MDLKKCGIRTSLMVQGLTPCLQCWSLGSIPAQGTRSCMPQLKRLHATAKIPCASSKTWCNRINWGGRWEGRLGWGRHVNPRPFHFNVWQNLLQKKKKRSRIKTKFNNWEKKILRKMWYVCIKSNVIKSFKRKEILPFATTWMDPEDIMQSDLSE